MRRGLIIVLLMVFSLAQAFAQVDRAEVRSGNRKFAKGNFRDAAVEYMRGLDKDSTSFASNYNLASVHYRLGDYESATEALGHIKDFAQESEHCSDYYFNLGDAAIARKQWQEAVDAFKQCLIADPGNLEAKENYIYAKKHLENQAQSQQNQNQDQNQDQDNQDQNQDNQNQNQDQNQDQNQNQQPQAAQVNVSPEQARQMLQAMQDKEKKTQEKVEKAKAAVGVKQNDKNW